MLLVHFLFQIESTLEEDHIMNRVLTMLSCFIMGVLLSLTMAAQASRGPAAKDVIAITKAEWSAAMSKNVSDQMKDVHDDCTMFVPDFPNRLDGKDTIYRVVDAESGGSGSLIMAEMANDKVQVFGDVAVLSYNFMGMSKDKDGKVEPTRAKSTRVYVKQGGRWLLVHANFAPADAAR